MSRTIRSMQAAPLDAATPIERMYFAWNDALSRNDANGLLALYARDAHFESPLVPHLLDTESGVLRGHDEMGPLFEKLAERKPPVRQYYRSGYLTDGQAPDLGIPARRRQRRADGLRRGDGTQRRRFDPAALRLLGLVRCPGAAT